jgi:hypothetical protein
VPENGAETELKPGQRATLSCPQDYLKELGPLPAGVQLADHLQGKFDWLQIFVKNKAQLDKFVPKVIRALKPESLLWVSYPKGTSKIQTDLTRDQGWEAIQTAGLKWLNLISVNATWSAFSLRLYKPGEPRQTFR